MTKEKIIIQIGDEIKELKGEELKTFEENRLNIKIEHEDLLKEIKIKNELKLFAYKKLGLTDEEIAAII